MNSNKKEPFVNNLHARPIICPACEQTHNVNELKAKGGTYPNFKCPKTGKEIVHRIGVVSHDEWFDLKEQENAH